MSTSKDLESRMHQQKVAFEARIAQLEQSASLTEASLKEARERVARYQEQLETAHGLTEMHLAQIEKIEPTIKSKSQLKRMPF